MTRKSDPKRDEIRRGALIALILLVALPMAATAAPLGSVITYQGQLLQSGSPASGDFDFVFNVYDGSDPLASILIATQTLFNVSVSGGLFAVELDFGDVWDGTELWLEIQVRPAGIGGLTSLFPLQKVTASPLALFSEDSDTLDGVDSTSFVTSESDPTVAANVKDGVSWSEVTSKPAGFADNVDDEGVTTESDPTVAASVKDGVSWGEVASMPAGFADGVDNTWNHVAATHINLNGAWITGNGTAGQGIFILPSGKVGIGTSNPQNALQVEGIIRAKGLGSATGTHLCIANSGALSACGSSRRYKEDIDDLATGFDLIEQLRPVTFRWKETGESAVGLIAEEVAEVDPLFVTYRDGVVEGVRYDQLTVVLINALKEQRATIEKLTAVVCADRPEDELCR